MSQIEEDSVFAHRRNKLTPTCFIVLCSSTGKKRQFNRRRWRRRRSRRSRRSRRRSSIK